MANSKEYVVHGATLKCTMGSKTATLKVSNNRKYTMSGKKVATIMDFAPGVNISPPLGAFGVCKPYTAVPSPGNLCTPILIGPWKMPYMPENIGLLRPLLGNSKIMCGRGGGIVSISKTGQNTQNPVIVKDNKEKCEKCGKEHSVRESDKQGNPVGSGSTLGRRLNRTKSPFHYVVELISNGRAYRAGSLQAHHLVLAETCNGNDDAKEAVEKYGYDINHKKNGILLPGFMNLACWLHQPVHNTNHDGGEIILDDGSKSSNSYRIYVKRMALDIIEPYANYDICERNNGLITELNAFSEKVRDNVLNFVWTISKDGHDYAPGSLIGCGNAKTPSEKDVNKSNGEGDCKCRRDHVIEKLSIIKEKVEQTKQVIANSN